MIDLFARQSQQGSLLVDKDDLVNGTSPVGAKSLNSPGPIFIGMVNNIFPVLFHV